MRPWRTIGLAATVLTVMSLWIPRSDVTVWSGNMCGRQGGEGEPCPTSGVRAGWPLTMVTDSPDSSAVGTLWLEDDWSIVGMALNLMFYAAMTLALLWLIRRARG